MCVSRGLESWKLWFERRSGTEVPICTSFVDTVGTFYAELFEARAESGVLEGSECLESYICPEEPIDRWMLLCSPTRVCGKVSLVAFGEAAAVDDASFEFGYPVGCGSESWGCVADSVPLLGSLPAQVCPAGDVGWVGDQLVGLACDVALRAAEYLAAGLALGGEAGGVGDAALVDAQADH